MTKQDFWWSGSLWISPKMQMVSVSHIVLTCPKKRKGNRNVSPFHIHDWNPSKNRKHKGFNHFVLWWWWRWWPSPSHTKLSAFLLNIQSWYVWLSASVSLASVSHPRSDPCCVFLPELAACTDTRSDNSTADTGQSLCSRQKKKRRSGFGLIQKCLRNYFISCILTSLWYKE